MPQGSATRTSTTLAVNCDLESIHAKLLVSKTNLDLLQLARPSFLDWKLLLPFAFMAMSKRIEK